MQNKIYSQIYTYTLIRCLYNKGQDYIDSFYPLIVNILPIDKTGLSLEAIQNEIKNKFSLIVPIHSLSVIATRAKKNGFIERFQRQCFLTDRGLEFLSKLESERDEIRRINEFVDEARNYLKSNHSLDEKNIPIELIIEKVIKENLEIFGSFLSSENNSNRPSKESIDRYEYAIIDFLFFVENSKPLLFKTLQDIIIGGIISSIVYTNNLEEPDEKISNIKVFFDSNYMFSLLGLRYSEQNKPAKELFELIKSQNNIELRIFDFTVDEMISVLKKYTSEQFTYPKGIKIDSLYSSLKAQGWTSADVKEFIVNVESKLKNLGIKIFPTPIEIDKYEPDNFERRSSLARYKTDQGAKEQNHDLAAIDQIFKVRKGKRKKIENCEALFLSSDLKLSKFNYLEDKHKENETISEVIPDKLFTNLLWLKNPTHINEIHLSSWITLNSRHFFIDRSVWKAFYSNLKSLRIQGQINDTDISILIYDTHIQEILRDTDPSDIHNIEAQWILDSIVEAKDRLNQQNKGEIKNLTMFFEEEIEKAKKEVEFISQEKNETEITLKSKLSNSDTRYKELEMRVINLEKEQKQKDEMLINSIIKWKKEQEIKSEKAAKLYLNVIIYTILIIFFICVILISSIILKNWNQIEPLVFIITFTVTVGLKIVGRKYDPFQLHLKLYEKIFNKVYSRKLKQITEVETKLSVQNIE